MAETEKKLEAMEQEADSEEHARLIVEQLNDDLDGWEHKDDCCVNWWHEFDERTPKVFEIKEL